MMLTHFDMVATRLAKLRDLIIVAAGFNYIVGYLLIALYAVEKGLGLVKPLDAQFIIAGLIPSAVLGMAIASRQLGNFLGRACFELSREIERRFLLKETIKPNWLTRHLKYARERTIISAARTKVMKPFATLFLVFMALQFGLILLKIRSSADSADSINAAFILVGVFFRYFLN